MAKLPMYDSTAEVPIPAPKQMFINFYHCERCDVEWTDIWDCMCDDECPACGKDFSPFKSEEVIDNNC